MAPSPKPWHRWLLLFPGRIEANLSLAREAGLVDAVPNTWQITLGVVRMWHRLLFRSDTIGTSRDHAIRPTLRARLLATRPLRFPFLIAERAVAPLDFSGLASPPERIVRHLLGAHHDGNQLAYDLELLSCHPGELANLHERVYDVVFSDTPRSRWLRDLTVFEGYHEKLLAVVQEALENGVPLSEAERNDPDISLSAYLRWCARQPRAPLETWAAMRIGVYSIADGRAASDGRTEPSPGNGAARAELVSA
jgi:hypothetical protein